MIQFVPNKINSFISFFDVNADILFMYNVLIPTLTFIICCLENGKWTLPHTIGLLTNLRYTHHDNILF